MPLLGYFYSSPLERLNTLLLMASVSIGTYVCILYMYMNSSVNLLLSRLQSLLDRVTYMFLYTCTYKVNYKHYWYIFLEEFHVSGYVGCSRVVSRIRARVSVQQ